MTGVFNNVTANGNNTSPFVPSIIGSGFEFDSNGSTGTITMTKSTFNSNGLSGVNIVVDSPSVLAPPTGTSPSVFTGTFDQVTANSNNNPVNASAALNNFGNGFDYRSDNSTGTVLITRSVFSTNGLNGVNFATSNGSMLTAQLINNNTTIAGNTGINANLQDGIGFQNNDSTVVATLLNNLITNNVGMGVNIVSTSPAAASTSSTSPSAGYLTQDTNRNGVLDPGEDNIVIPSLNFPPHSPEFIVGNGLLDREGNTITGNHGAGISFHLVDNSGGTFSSTGQAKPSSATSFRAPASPRRPAPPTSGRGSTSGWMAPQPLPTRSSLPPSSTTTRSAA